MNPNPNCPREDCRFAFGAMSSTAMYFEPIYDKHGNNVNPDLNIRSGSVTCHTCGKKWTYSICGNETTVSEVV